jgi:acyl-coenzyme A synthetase/AMP-(fatty) acid ligase
MGDVGYLDTSERFWFCGRKTHRVQTSEGVMYTIPVEAIFNQHPAIFRSALVGIGPVGGQVPVVVVEPHPENYPNTQDEIRALEQELSGLGQANEKAASVRHFLVHPSLPVDIRHNSKIFREKLAVWAEARLGGSLGLP